MRNLLSPECMRWRRPDLELSLYGMKGDEGTGVFVVPSKRGGEPLTVICSSGEGWDHVSVSLASRIPGWSDMDDIKRLFFKDDEVAMQLHVPIADHVNRHRNCLHLWRPQLDKIPLPPKRFV